MNDRMTTEPVTIEAVTIEAVTIEAVTREQKAQDMNALNASTRNKHEHRSIKHLQAVALAILLVLGLNLLPQQAQATAVVVKANDTLELAKGWNLAGNGTDAALDVGTLFADTSRFVTVWKWVPGQNVWAFYAPALAAQGGTVLADYAAGKGYQLLTTVGAGEGFWVNTKDATSVTVPSGNPTALMSLAKLVTGWNLAALGEAATPKQVCDAQSGLVTTLWAWDATNSAWYFYAPSLDASGGLAAYISAKGYLDFNANGKTLGTGTGFWVNRR